MLNALCLQKTQEKFDKMENRIFRLREQISENLAHKWTIEEMAKTINVSESYFIKIFKTATEMSPIAWLCDVRLEKARELLEGDWEHISVIARKVGMPNLSHFTRDFKKQFGKTPTAYRRDYHDERQAKIMSGQK